MDRSARPCRPLGHFAGRRAGRGFVASYRRKPGTWTAISRPPYFTALAVWPKGDTWGGGGLFVQRHALSSLWHDTEVKYGIDQFKLLDDFTLPKRFRVQPFDGHSPVPDCDIEQSRMVLSGWRFVQRYVWRHGAIRVRRARDHGAAARSSEAAALRAAPLAHRRSRSVRAEVHDLTAGTQRDLGRVDWVDADHNGDVLWSAGGRLFRLAGPRGRA